MIARITLYVNIENAPLYIFVRYIHIYIARNNYKTIGTRTLTLIELYRFKIEKKLITLLDTGAIKRNISVV